MSMYSTPSVLSTQYPENQFDPQFSLGSSHSGPIDPALLDEEDHVARGSNVVDGMLAWTVGSEATRQRATPTKKASKPKKTQLKPWSELNQRSGEDDAKFRCFPCEKDFVTTKALHRHLKSTGIHCEKSLICEFCNKKFVPHKSNFKRHQDTCKTLKEQENSSQEERVHLRRSGKVEQRDRHGKLPIMASHHSRSQQEQKDYIQYLQQKNTRLEQEKYQLQQEKLELKERVDSMQSEIDWVKSHLANPAIGSYLRQMPASGATNFMNGF